MTKAHQITGDYGAWLHTKLQDKEVARAHLQVALDAYQNDQDKKALLLALKDVAEAQGGIGWLAKETHLNREHHFLSDPWINLTYEAFLECKVYFAPQKCKNKNRFLLVARNQTWEFQYKKYLEDVLRRMFKESSREELAPVFCYLVENGSIVFLSL